MNLCFLHQLIGSCFQLSQCFTADQPTCKVDDPAGSHANVNNGLGLFTLGWILVSKARTQDKASLRLTCKLFRDILDSSLVCIGPRPSRVTSNQVARKFLQRVQQSKIIKTTALNNAPPSSSRLFRYLPNQLTTLALVGEYGPHPKETLDLTDLKHLRCLTALSIQYRCKLSGLECIKGLTSLISFSPIDSVSHLAPTLKHLYVDDCPPLEELNKLTNVEVLQLRGHVPTDIFEGIDQVPLKSLFIRCCNFNNTRLAWEAAPASLTCLTIVDPSCVHQRSRPVHISHLQLVSAIDLASAAYFLPGITALDVHTQFTPSDDEPVDPLPCTAFSYLEKFTNLQCLRLCLGATHCPWDRRQVLTRLPDVAAAVERGVTLHVLKSEEEMLGGVLSTDMSRPYKSQWANCI